MPREKISGEKLRETLDVMYEVLEYMKENEPYAENFIDALETVTNEWPTEDLD